VQGLAVNPPSQCSERQRWLGYHCPFFADLSSVGRSRYRTSMYTSSSSPLAVLLASQVAAQKTKNRLYCAPSLTNSPILLSIALSSRPVLPTLLAPAASRCALFFHSISTHLQPFAMLFLNGTTHLKAPRPFPVRTRSVRTREAVC
jgi:hypothetical protein